MIKHESTKLPIDIRARHLVSALRDYTNTEVSLRLVENGNDPTGLFGSLEEVRYALSRYCYESQDLYASFTAEEIKDLKEEGVLTEIHLEQLAELPEIESKPEQDDSLNDGVPAPTPPVME